MQLCKYEDATWFEGIEDLLEHDIEFVHIGHRSTTHHCIERPSLQHIVRKRLFQGTHEGPSIVNLLRQLNGLRTDVHSQLDPGKSLLCSISAGQASPTTQIQH